MFTDKTEGKWRQPAVERLKSMPNFKNSIKAQAEKFAKEIVQILCPIRLGFLSYEGFQVFVIESITRYAICIQEEVVKLYPDAATEQFIFKNPCYITISN